MDVRYDQLNKQDPEKEKQRCLGNILVPIFISPQMITLLYQRGMKGHPYRKEEDEEKQIPELPGQKKRGKEEGRIKYGVTRPGP